MKSIFLLTIPLLVWSNYLVRIDNISKNDIMLLNSLGINTIENFGDATLALVSKKELVRVGQIKARYEILDVEPMNNIYYIVSVEDKKTKERIAEIGEILSVHDGLFLIKISDESKIVELNKLKTELKRIFFTPMVVKTKEYPTINVTRDTLIQQMVNIVSADTIIAIVQRLQAFRTRYSTTDSAHACAQWIKNKFISYGFDSVYTETFSTSYAPNVIAIKKGVIYPGRNYVVGCGHYDCTSQTPTTFAPGADDNGSGTAGVLESARALRNYQFEHSIRLIAFCGEEQGLLGSYYYAQRAYNMSDTILGAVNLDMFAYSTPNRDSLTIINDTTYINNLWLANYFSACADTYTMLKKKVWTGRRPQSDHASFSRFGYSAIQGRENLNVSNPYYHTTGDTIGGGFNALTMCYEGIKAAVATIASLAKPYVPTAIDERLSQTGELKIGIYPNILRNTPLKIDFYMPRTEKVYLSIINPLGQVIESQIINVSQSKITQININVNLRPGVYFVQLQERENISIKKIVVLP